MRAFRLSVPLLVVAGTIGSAAPPPAAVCALVGSGTAKGAQFFIEPVKPSARDTVLTARLCLVPPKAGVGSYHVTLAFDSSAMRAIRVDVSGGLQAKNLAVPGVIILAGAAPAGFARGSLVTIVFKPRTGKTLAKIRLTLVEANAISGVALLADSKVAGYPSTDRTLGVIEPRLTAVGTQPLPAGAKVSVPHIDSISPKSGKVDNESVFEVALYGKGFAADGNVVLFDAATVERSVTERGGTILKFIVPTMIPAHGQVQFHRIEEGKFSVKVRTAAGTSNAVTFTVRGEDR